VEGNDYFEQRLEKLSNFAPPIVTKGKKGGRGGELKVRREKHLPILLLDGGMGAWNYWIDRERARCVRKEEIQERRQSLLPLCKNRYGGERKTQSAGPTKHLGDCFVDAKAGRLQGEMIGHSYQKKNQELGGTRERKKLQRSGKGTPQRLHSRSRGKGKIASKRVLPAIGSGASEEGLNRTQKKRKERKRRSREWAQAHAVCIEKGSDLEERSSMTLKQEKMKASERPGDGGKKLQSESVVKGEKKFKKKGGTVTLRDSVQAGRLPFSHDNFGPKREENSRIGGRSVGKTTGRGGEIACAEGVQNASRKKKKKKDF